MARDGKERRSDETPFWEWVVTAFGVLLVLGAAGFLVYGELTGGESPPDIVVQADSVHRASSAYLVTFRAINTGGSTAARLRIEGQLLSGGQAVETSEATLDYVPAHSERAGGLFFSRDPRAFNLSLRATGFELP